MWKTFAPWTRKAIHTVSSTLQAVVGVGAWNTVLRTTWTRKDLVKRFRGGKY